jgi:hypothetical protein
MFWKEAEGRNIPEAVKSIFHIHVRSRSEKFPTFRRTLASGTSTLMMETVSFSETPKLFFTYIWLQNI